MFFSLKYFEREKALHAKTKRERLTGRELQAIELMISTNMTQVEIAKEIGVCDETVHRWTKKSLFQAKLEEENKKRFHGLAVEAQKEMERLAFKGKQEQIRLQACKDIGGVPFAMKER